MILDVGFLILDWMEAELIAQKCGGPYYAPNPLRGACFAKASQPEGAEDVSKGADAGGKEQKRRTRELLLWGSKLAENAASEVFVNFVMARDGLAEPG